MAEVDTPARAATSPIDIVGLGMKPLDFNPGSTVKVLHMTRHTAASPTEPNHHAHFPAFAGVSGYVAAISMRFGRTDVAELAIELTGLESGSRLVDVGCGPGVAARLAASRGAIVTGVDPSPVMLRVARMDDRSNAITWKEGTAEAMPIADGGSDIVWSLSTVHHWDDVNGGLTEARRVLVPGGRFLVTERRVQPGATGLGSHGWTDAQAETFAGLAEAFLTDVEITSHGVRRGALLAVVGTVAARE